MKKNKKKNQENKDEKKISRKEAIIMGSKYAALTAATFWVLSPKKSQAQSPAEPGWGR